jgi:hypothetical protein
MIVQGITQGLHTITKPADPMDIRDSVGRYRDGQGLPPLPPYLSSPNVNFISTSSNTHSFPEGDESVLGPGCVAVVPSIPPPASTYSASENLK